jgi:hypothetical protein
MELMQFGVEVMIVVVNSAENSGFYEERNLGYPRVYEKQLKCFFAEDRSNVYQPALCSFSVELPYSIYPFP